jgi:hypothetical protein
MRGAWSASVRATKRALSDLGRTSKQEALLLISQQPNSLMANMYMLLVLEKRGFAL